MPKLDGKVAVVTGGASGIGAGVCTRFVAKGARVVVADIDDERGEQLAAELGYPACYQHTDVTSEKQIVDAIDAAVDRWGRLDVMMSNAGQVGVWRFLEDIPTEAWDTTFALLCRSAFLGIKHASRVMRDNGNGGSIINTGSVAGFRAGYGPHPYGAAKAALLGLGHSAAVELAPFGIRVNTLIPGTVATRIVGHGAGLEGEALDSSVEQVRNNLQDMQPMPRGGEPEDLAAAALFLASDDSSYITGHELVVDGGLTLGRSWPAEGVAVARKSSSR